LPRLDTWFETPQKDRLPPLRRHSTPPKKERRSQGGAVISYPGPSLWISSWDKLGFGNKYYRLLLGGG